MFKIKIFSVCLLIFIVSFLMVGCQNKAVEQQGVIKIGVTGPLTGEAIDYGESIKEGQDLALEEINQQGGILGKKFRLVYEDHKCSPREATATFKKLVEIDKLDIIVDQACSSAFLTEAKLAEENNVLLLGASHTHPDIADAGDNIFRIIASDAYQGAFLAELTKKWGYKEVGVLYLNNELGLELKNIFQGRFIELGGRISIIESHEEGLDDMRGQLTKIKMANPDLLFIPTHINEAILILKQSAELSMDIPLLGVEGVKDVALVEKTGQAAEGFMVVFHKENRDNKWDEFYQAFKEKYNHEPRFYAEYGYDSVKLIAYAIEKAGSVDVEEIKKVLYETHDYHGASGLINFDEDGEVVGKEYEVWEVREGEFVKIE